MRNLIRNGLSVVFFGMLAVGSRGATAQDDRPFRDRIVELRKERLAEELNLAKDKEAAVMAMYDEYMIKERELMQRRGELFKRLTHMSALADEVSEDKILKAIIDLQDAERKIREHHDQLAEKMKKELKPWQLGRMILFEEKFHQKMRQLMFDVKGKGKKWKRFDIPPPHEGIDERVNEEDK